ncbi:unnamed protein product [Rotaria socialis]
MGEWYKPNTPFSTQPSGFAKNNDVTNHNLEDMFTIETKAIARLEKNQEQKNCNSSNQINDISWLNPSPSSTNECNNNRANQNPTVSSSETLGHRDIDFFVSILEEKKEIFAIVISKHGSRAAVMGKERVFNSNDMEGKAPIAQYKQALFSRRPPLQSFRRPTTAVSRSPTQYYKVLREKDCTIFLKQDTFCEKLKDALVADFLVQTQILNGADNRSEENVAYTIVLSGSQLPKVTQAYDALDLLLTTSLKIKFVDKNIGTIEIEVFIFVTLLIIYMAGFWVCKPEAAHIIQTYANQANITCYCDASEYVGLKIYYFSSTMVSLKSLCTTEVIIDDIITRKFLSTKIQIPKSLDAISANKYVSELETFSVQSCDKNIARILLIKQEVHLLIFGLVDSVEQLIAENEKIKQDLSIAPAKHDLTDYQIDFLLGLYQNELKQLGVQNEDLQIFDGIKNGYFTGPRKMHDIIKEELHRMAGNSRQSQFSIEDVRFGSIAETEQKEFMKISLNHNCLLKIKLESIDKNYPVPISCLDKGTAELIPAAMSIDIRVGDLALQSVDMVVVCSTSQYLLNDILKKAGTNVKENVDAAMNSGRITKAGYETIGGELLCKQLFFLPWITDKVDYITLRQTIQTFFTTAMQHALNTGKTSIAFPALGCGALKCDPNMIAEIILDETQRYANYNLKILIVLLPDKNENYRAFCVKLAELRQKTLKTNPTKLSYRYTTVKLTLTGLEENLKKCWKVIQDYINERVLTEECDDFPLHTWNQSLIDSFYRYCLERHVLPEVNTIGDRFKLSGPKEQVKMTQIEFYRLKCIKAEEARIASYARIAVWLFEIEDRVFKKYSLKLNALIETASANGNELVTFRNDHDEECKILLKDKLEIFGERKRRIIRRDFRLPPNWIAQADNVVRCVLKVNDNEYTTVLEQFNETMSGKYTQIQIERIQNQRWYMAYKAYKHFFKHKNTEQSLFHGCPESSADMIIHSCFNRSFAGVNGVAFGVGVYFSTQASYSDSYTRASPNTNGRCMFLAKVLVGRSTLGNSHMKTAPTGYDSTTDNKMIYVTYHDDQAYAAYLISYVRVNN